MVTHCTHNTRGPRLCLRAVFMTLCARHKPARDMYTRQYCEPSHAELGVTSHLAMPGVRFVMPDLTNLVQAPARLRRLQRSACCDTGNDTFNGPYKHGPYKQYIDRLTTSRCRHAIYHMSSGDLSYNTPSILHCQNVCTNLNHTCVSHISYI